MTRLLFLLLPGATLLAQPPRYILNDLGGIGDNTVDYSAFAVTGINIRGQVIGYETQVGGRVRSFRTASNSAINWLTDDLGSLGGSITRAQGINSSGQVAGDSTLSSGETRAFRTAAEKSIQPATDNLGSLAPSSASGERSMTSAKSPALAATTHFSQPRRVQSRDLSILASATRPPTRKDFP